MRELWISPIMRLAELNERPSYNGLNKTTFVILLLQCNLVMKRETSSRIVIEIMYNVLKNVVINGHVYIDTEKVPWL